MLNTQNKIAGFLSVFVSTVGMLVIVGWQLDIEFLKRPIPNLVAMNPVTAVGFMLSGIAVFSTLKQDTSGNKFKWLALLTSALIILIGLLKLSDLLFSTGIKEEEWLFNYKIFNDQLRNVSSRIAPGTAINFILLGSSILLSNTGKSINRLIANYLALAAFLIGLFSTLGYVYNVPEFIGILAAHPMAVHTAICFLLTSFAIMLINHDKGFVYDFSGSGATVLAAKVLIPGIVLFPFFLGLLLLYIVHNYNISAELVVAFGVSGITIIFFLITWYISRQLNKISSRRDEAEKELLLSHERFFKFFKASPVATNIVNIRTSKFVHVNHAFLKLFSFTREQVIGKNSAELNMIDSATREKLLKVVREKGFNYENLEVKLRDAKGNLIEVLSSTQKIEINGEPHMLSTLVDITERKKFEEELVKNRQSLNDAQKLSKTGSWEYNLKTGELFWSDELYHIFEVEHTPPEKLFEVCRGKIHPDDIANLDDAINLANEVGVAAVYEHRVIMKNGSIKHLLGLGEIIKDKEGNPLWLKGTTQDITERKITEEILRQNYIQLDIKNKELEQFAFIASHNLQEPLRTISSFTDLLTEEYAAKFDNNANTYVRFIAQSTNRMRDLISGLLEYSRLGSKRILQQTNCNQVLNNALANLHAAITESGAVIKAEKLPVIKAFPLELELLFQNLIGNAIKFKKRGSLPEIKIGAKKSGNNWQFSFADNGIGIEEKHFQKIFLLFQRLHSRDNYEGSGIGLSHCKKIVELHNGRIWVESKSGEGSIFYFTIPENPM
ncbi:MAG: ATP-binding protein [Bacteroidia bacterium]